MRHHGEVVAEIPNRELADEAPLYDRPHTKPRRSAAPEPPLPPGDVQEALPALLASPDLCSKRWIWEQYDYQVRTNTIAGPEHADAAIVRIKETGASVAMSLDGNQRYCYLDPREGAKLAVAECCRNLATVGAQPVAATNCLNFGNPERPEIMAQLVEAIEGIAEACAFFDTPITGGNVSLYNETLGEGIYPTPVLGIVGMLNTAAPVTIPFQERRPQRGAAGRPRAAATMTRFRRHAVRQGDVLTRLWGLPPALDMDYEKRVHEAMREILAEGLAESAHDLSDGGLAVALAECSFGQAGIGAQLDLDSDLRPGDALLPRSALAHPDFHRASAEGGGHRGAARRGRSVAGVTIEKGIEIRQRAMTLGSWEISESEIGFTARRSKMP